MEIVSDDEIDNIEERETKLNEGLTCSNSLKLLKVISYYLSNFIFTVLVSAILMSLGCQLVQ